MLADTWYNQPILTKMVVLILVLLEYARRHSAFNNSGISPKES